MAVRVLCARFAHLGLVAAWRRHPELRDEPVVLWGETPPGRTAAKPPLSPASPLEDSAEATPARVVAASEAARAAGVRPGQPLRQARQLCPAAALLPLDVGAVAELRSAVLDALCELAPAVELSDEEAWCDLSGRHAAHRDELAWAASIARGLAGVLNWGTPPGRTATKPPLSPASPLAGVVPAVGLASTRHVALVAARLASPGRVRRVRAGEEAATLAPLPVGMLPADPAILARLGDLGLDRVGQVAALSPADLQRQFGPAGLELHGLARGQVEERLDVYRPPSVLAERIVLDGPVADLEVLRRCTERATEALGEQLLVRGLVATRVELALEPEQGGSSVLEGGGGSWSAWRIPPIPAGSAADLWPAALGLLGAVRPDAPVAALRLIARGLEAASGRQSDLWRRGDASRDSIAVAVTRLRDRFGESTVLRPRLALDPGDLPERRFVWELDAASPQPAVVAPVEVVAPAAAAIPAPPERLRPPVVRADIRPDWRDGEGPVSRVRRERPAADGSRVDSLDRLRASVRAREATVHS